MKTSVLLLAIYNNNCFSVVLASYLSWNYFGIIFLCCFQVSLTVEGSRVWLE